MAKKNTVLVIPDLQAPFYHKDALAFLKAVRKQYKPNIVINVGDECFPGDAEVLTKDGWIKFNKLKDQEVLQYNEDKTVEFVSPLRKIEKKYTGDMVLRKKGNWYSYTTANHDLVLKNDSGKLVKQKAQDSINQHYIVPRVGLLDGPGINLTDDQIRLFVAVSADFTLRESGDLYASLKKERKVERITGILNRLGLRYSNNKDSRDYNSIFIHRGQVDYCAKEFPTSWLTETSLRQKQLILDELQYWDGHRSVDRDRTVYCSSLPSNIEFVQTLSHLAGYEASVRQVNSEFGISYQTSILTGKTGTRLKSNIIKTEVTDLDVFCVTVPSGMLMVRQDNKITVSGNCDFHALGDWDHDPDGMSPGDELRAAIESLQPFYKEFPNSLVCNSNHTERPFRKALKMGLPKAFLKTTREFLEAPKGWEWSDSWEIDGVIYEHGVGASGQQGAIKSAMLNMQSTVIGHIHSHAGILWYANDKHLIFGFNVGCLIDRHAYAFQYGKHYKSKPILGCGIVKNGIPTFIPMILNNKGRWIGKL